MRKLTFMLEYGCIPIWIHDGDELIGIGLPADLSCNKELSKLLNEISSEYDNLYINNSIEFSYKGFSNNAEENAFNDKVKRAISILESIVSNKYIIEIDENVFDS